MISFIKLHKIVEVYDSVPNTIKIEIHELLEVLKEKRFKEESIFEVIGFVYDDFKREIFLLRLDGYLLNTNSWTPPVLKKEQTFLKDKGMVYVKYNLKTNEIEYEEIKE